MEQMGLIKLGVVGPLAPLPGDVVLLLQGADNDLGLIDLILAQLAVPGQLRHSQAEVSIFPKLPIILAQSDFIGAT